MGKSRLFFIFFRLSVSVAELERNILFNRLPDTNCLSQIRLLNAILDRIVSIWFATSSGLIRYGGVETKLYISTPSITDSLSHQVVQCLPEVQQENFWLGTRNGLNYQNPRTGKVQRSFSHSLDHQSLSHDYILHIAQDHAGQPRIDLL